MTDFFDGGTLTGKVFLLFFLQKKKTPALLIAALAPPIVVLTMTALDWRSVFYICGAVGVLWSVLWYFAFRNLPEEHALGE
jgi:sugar phosphate permease